MFVHGEQADTILASLLALMAALQSHSRCQIVTYPCFVIIAKPHKTPLVLLSDTAHPKSVRRKTKSLARTLKVVNKGDTDDACLAKMPVRTQRDVQAD